MEQKHPKNWLILTQYFPPELGAPQIRLSSMIEELRNHNIIPDVLTAMPNYPKGKLFDGYKNKFILNEKYNEISVKRTWIYAATGKSAIPRLLNYFSFTLTAALAALTGPKPEVIFLESQPLSLGVVALLMKWIRKVPYIYNIPDLQIEVAKQMDFMGNKTFLNLSNKLETYLMKNSWKVSTVTEAFMKHINEHNGIDKNKITFLPNGADTNFLKPKPPNKELLSKWNINNQKVFVYVGTHAFYHGLDVIVETAALLKNNEEILFLMIGDGPERKRIIEKAQTLKLKNIKFEQSPYEEMAELYSIAYASIACLKNINVATQMRLSKIFPSLSCEVPVIYAGKGEAATIIDVNKCGLTVEPENPSELAKAILSLSANENYKKELGKAGRNMVQKSYSWKTIINNWIKQLNLNHVT